MLNLNQVKFINIKWILDFSRMTKKAQCHPGEIQDPFFLMESFLIFFAIFSLFFSSAVSFAQETQSTETSSETTPVAETTETVPSFWKKNFQYSGALRQETAFRFASDPGFSKIKQFVKADVRFHLNEHLNIKFGGRAYYDAAYDVTDHYPEDVQENMRKEVLLRDAYLDVIYSKVRLRAGHQQIVWGEALAQFYADVVSPKDLREFLLPDFEDVRLMIWALDLQINFSSKGVLELVLVPDQTIDKLALPGADFAFFLPPPPPGVEQVLLPNKSPETNFSNMKGGARISYLTHGWDLAGIYYTTPDLIPAYQKSFAVDVETSTPQVILNPIHPRIQNFGFTFSKSVGPVVTRGEFVYTLGKLFNSKDPMVNQGLVQRNQFRYDIGLDYFIANKVFMNAEFQQEVIYGSTGEVADDILKTWMFFRFESRFLREKLIPSLIFNIGFDLWDTQVSPRITYWVIPTVSLAWGVDLFSGPIQGLYGEFNQSSRVYMNTTWRF